MAVTSHLGIRYARAARFEPPDLLAWDGGSLGAFGPAAPQLPGTGMVPGDVTPAAMDDDCLFLNVWTPDAPGPHPVFVWFHGGGFLSGGTADPTIDGTRLAEAGPLVVVTVAYRLGALGFSAVGATNCGLRDQLAALEWVARHIDGLGGDPANVTIAGESAGGGSVLHLLTTPGIERLARRAISQSGATEYTRTRDEAGRVTEVYVDALGGDDPRAVPVARVIEAQGHALMPLMMEMARMPFHPCVDGDVVTARPAEALAAGAAAGVDLLIGTTSDEMRLFLMEASLADVQMRKRVDRYLGHDASDVVAAYQDLVGDDPMDVWAAIFSDREMLLPARRVADAHQGATYRYLFTWEVAARADGLALRACHAADLPFPFGSLDVLSWREWTAATGGRAGPGDALSAAMQSAWCRFAATGDPGWAPHETGRVQVFGETVGEAADPLAARAAVWAAART